MTDHEADQTREPFSELVSQEAREIDQTAKQLIYQLCVLMRIASMHGPTNEALIKPARDLATTIGRLLRFDSTWCLRMLHDHLFINENRIRLTQEYSPHYLKMVEEFKCRGIGLLSFARIPNENETIKFIYIFINYQEEMGFHRLLSMLIDAGLTFVSIDPSVEESIDGLAETKGQVRKLSRETFFRSIFTTGGILKAVDTKKVVNIRRARRMIQGFLDLLEMDDNYLLGLTMIKNYDDYTFNHSVNVAILALNMGRLLGFNRLQLTDLGLSAIFHDLGKTSIPHDLINKEKDLDEEEWKIIHKHPLEGVKKLLQLKGVSELTVKLIISVYEHHMNFDYSGYPGIPVSEEATLFSRVIRIVDSYDAMTTSRSYRRSPKHPVAALEEIWNLAGKTFDPVLVKAFIFMMGLYPVGTIVQLSSGEIGIVSDRDREASPGHQEKIEVLTSWGQTPFSHGEVIDLSRDPELSIVGYYDFGMSKYNPAWYLLTMSD